VLADITAYEVGLYFHVLAVIIGLGVTFAHPVMMAWAENFAPQAVPVVWSGLRRVDRLLVTPGLIIILLAGLYMTSEGEISLGESWITVGLVAVIALLGMTHAYFGPRWERGIVLAERDLKSGDALSSEFAAVSRQMAVGGVLAIAIILVTVFFMVVKP
jgi:uncharacterized membrane protein